jgi:hypothetical protein
MIAIVFTALILMFSAAFGYLVFRSVARRRPSKWITVPISIVLALVILIFAGVGYLWLGSSAPFADDPNLLAESTIEIKGFHGTPDKAAALPNRNPDCWIRIHYRNNTKLSDDFVVRLDTSVGKMAPVSAHFSVPEDWKLRTSNTCKSGKNSDACAPMGSENSVNWIVRPEQTSTSIWEVSLALDGHEWCTSPWFALFYENGSPIAARTRSGRAWASSTSGYATDTGFREVLVATNAQPTLQESGWDINLSKPAIRGKTLVVKTLGVSSATYENLALLGAVGSSALGSGWLISLIGYLWSKFRKKRSSESES